MGYSREFVSVRLGALDAGVVSFLGGRVVGRCACKTRTRGDMSVCEFRSQNDWFF